MDNTMLIIPKPVLHALHILQSSGIPAYITRMYGTEHTHYVITLPEIEIKEQDANSQPEIMDKHRL